MAESLCGACGRRAHRYSTADLEHGLDMQACINGLVGELERLKTADLYRQGWRDATHTVMVALGVELPSLDPHDVECRCGECSDV